MPSSSLSSSDSDDEDWTARLEIGAFLRRGAQFERAEGGRNGDGKTGFFGYRCGLPGAVVGGVAGLALIAVLIYFLACKKTAPTGKNLPA